MGNLLKVTVTVDFLDQNGWGMVRERSMNDQKQIDHDEKKARNETGTVHERNNYYNRCKNKFKKYSFR